MKIAMIGLGKMGANMTQRLIEHGHEVVAFDLSESGPHGGGGLRGRARRHPGGGGRQADAPRVAWVMVPAGEATNSTITTLAGLFESGDVIIDGGNSNYKETAPLVDQLAAQGIALVDAGTSGGIWGLKEGYCLMVGGTKEAVAVAEPIFLDLAPEGGYAHVGPPGAGHFVKMVHNGIEYGLMQAYAEGFEIMSEAPEFDLDLHQISAIWRYGSVVRSWLLELAERALRPESGFDQIEGVVADSGEGRWTVEEAINRGVSAPVISSALFARFASQKKDAFGTAAGVGPAQPVRRARLHHHATAPRAGRRSPPNERHRRQQRQLRPPGRPRGRNAPCPRSCPRPRRWPWSSSAPPATSPPGRSCPPWPDWPTGGCSTTGSPSSAWPAPSGATTSSGPTSPRPPPRADPSGRP